MRITRSLPNDVAEWHDSLVSLGWLAAPFISLSGIVIPAMWVTP